MSFPVVDWTRRQLWLALAAVGLAWALAAVKWPLLGQVVPWDSKTQFYAFFRFLGLAAGEGATPLWNPYHYMGHPSVADPQSLVFQPAFRLLALLAPNAGLALFDAIVFAHLLVGMVGMILLGRHLGWHPLAAILAAMVFAFGGSASARLSHTGIMLGYGLFPLALVLLWRAIDRGEWRSGLAFAVVASLIALGRDQVAIMLCLTLLAAALARLATLERPWSRLPLLAGIAGLGLICLAAPLLLTLEFAGLSNRPAIEYATAAAGSLHPVNAATLFAPDVFGSLSPEETGYFGPDARSRPWVDTTDRMVNYLFVGTFPAVLLLWLGVGGGGLASPAARFAFAVAVVWTLYALGWFTPLYEPLYRLVPGVALFRRPADATFPINIAIALVVGAAASHVAAHGWPRIGWIGRVVAITIGLAAAAGAIWFATFAEQETHAATQIAIAAGTMIVCGLALRATRAERARIGLMALLVVATALELNWRNVANQLNAEPAANYAVLERPTGALAAALDKLGTELASARRAGERPRVEILGLGGAAQNLAMVRGLEAINGYNPLRIAAVDRLIDPGQNNHEVGQRRFPATFESWDSGLAREIGLGWLVLGTRLHKIPSARDILDAQLLTETRGTRLYRLAHAGPRARLLGPGSARVAAFRADRVAVSVEASAATTLVTADPSYPGWVARVNGARAAITTTNGLDRRVEVPAGRSEVVFTFEPLAFANLARIARGMVAR